jgi:UDP-N-acetylmuramyl pentapeptide phosphotransferase/UDP-N-acetylglucosamine-1-phosphate transferase
VEAVGWVPAWAVLLLVSLRDDVRGLAIPVRLGAHAACALWFAWWIVPAGNAGPAIQLAQVLAAGLIVAWSLNLYNFMDGNDGLAALMAIVGFAAYGIAGAASPTSSLVAFAVAFAALPFFFVNRPPARMFMGDVGAVPLGFLAATLGLAGVLRDLWGAWFPVLVFLPFVADATLTLLRRAGRRERWWEGHRSHYYQRLHQLGAGHAGTLAVYAALILGTSVTAVACARLAPEWGWRVLLVWCVVLVLPFGAIDYHWARKSTGTP